MEYNNIGIIHTNCMPAKTRAPKSLEPFTGAHKNHIRTGAKFYVCTLSRSSGARKATLIKNGSMTQFQTMKDAVAYSRYYSRKNDGSIYVILGTSGYEKAIKAAWTNGKPNVSLTAELKRIYGKKAKVESSDYDILLKSPR